MMSGISTTRARDLLHLDAAGPDAVAAIVRLSEGAPPIKAESLGIGIGRFRTARPGAVNDRQARETLEGLLQRNDWKSPPQDVVYDTLDRAYVLARQERSFQGSMFGETEDFNVLLDGLALLAKRMETLKVERAAKAKLDDALAALPNEVDVSVSQKRTLEDLRRKLQPKIKVIEKEIRGEERSYIQSLRNKDSVAPPPPPKAETPPPVADVETPQPRPPEPEPDPIPAPREEPTVAEPDMAEEMALLREREALALRAVKEMQEHKSDPLMVDAVNNNLENTRQEITSLEARMGLVTREVTTEGRMVTEGGETTVDEAREAVERILGRPRRADEPDINTILPGVVRDVRAAMKAEDLGEAGHRMSLAEYLASGKQPKSPTAQRMTARELDELQEEADKLDDLFRIQEELEAPTGQRPARTTDPDIRRIREEDPDYRDRRTELYSKAIENWEMAARADVEDFLPLNARSPEAVKGVGRVSVAEQ